MNKFLAENNYNMGTKYFGNRGNLITKKLTKDIVKKFKNQNSAKTSAEFKEWLNK